MPDGLYERDALAWAEQQVALLRRLAAGERLNEAVDWSNVIEEVGDVGLSELRACQSLLQQAMTHLLKLACLPEDDAVRHWRVETGAFLDDAARRFTPSMEGRIELGELYARAVRRARESIPGHGALPASCPFALRELLEGDIAELVTRVANPP